MDEKLLINLQWRSFIRYCAEHGKEGIVKDMDCNVTLYSTRSFLIFTNRFFLSSAVLDEEDLRQRLNGVNAYLLKNPQNYPWVLYIERQLLPDDLREKSKNIFSENGFHLEGTYKCMQTTSLLPPVRSLPIVDIEFATSERIIYDALLLNTQAYNLDSSVTGSIIEHQTIFTDFNKLICCVVYIDSKPISTATTMLLDECLYVVLVATPEQHRRNGYGEVALRASMERALQKFPHTKYGLVLHATKLGQSVYQRIGFKNITDSEMYIHK
ncbi:hypothetical protein I4U23_010633 [Adineta vaga]|nr:hypothetical protein I4U23_010633 [Adineta vaga]